ncbi:hypothetical protein UFOVP276_210 [uncultured Caudovirales phage]|uniref:Uncharacterized protein n=1 Tax=uncultured Caudovirales phage TaxID=2100421 RepID=A0A6J5LL41_9CAUD|nr:hypothetical protein UFOVP127_104 [uncultured Caudovirales phage]CAB4135254.1 hypothetical protein UFOVP276_210 [uncultured Caudovirales phage]
MKIKIHSMTDLITNSSTTIYTYSDASESAMRNMIEEFFKVFGIDKKCDEVFTLTVTCKSYDYSDRVSNLDDMPEEFKGLGNKEIQAKTEEILAKVVSGEINKPQWMTDVEKDDHWDNRPATTLNIEPKAPEYAALAKLLLEFLYSTESVEGEC